MIEKMKTVQIAALSSGKDAMLKQLRALGVMHISEKKSADREASEKYELLSKAIQEINEYTPKQFSDPGVQSDGEFEEMYRSVQNALEKKRELLEKITEATAELERIQAWGEFSPKELAALKDAGLDLHFYRFGKQEYEMAAENENVKLIRLAPVDKMETAAVLGVLPAEISASEFVLPERGMKELQATITDCRKKLTRCEKILSDAAIHKESFAHQLRKALNEVQYSSASETVQDEGGIIWISGYIPEEDMERFKAAAGQSGWGWAIDDVADDDEKVPTKIRYNKVTRLMKPVFDILGILPGYREQDISLWFLLFFTLFFAMIIGDAGYGFIILLGTLAITLKTKKCGNAQFLLFVLSLGTIVWGAVTGTWFGMESAMKVPLLKALVIPSFANYPEYFGLTATAQQNAIMKFSFSLGAIQMLLGSLLSVRKKIREKNLSFIADIGWMIAVAAMYLLSLYLVIGEKLPIMPIFLCVGVAFVLVVLFGGMSPDKSFGEGLKAGLGDAFTAFLNTISCFGNVMSYIRLFAVGMAGLAIAQSFNNMAAGFNGPLIILGALIVLIGHALNLVMAFLSVVVHGVRLNVLEFSGQAGVEWAGTAYEPFKETNETTINNGSM